MTYINLNGKITAAETGLPVDNGSFRYGYGLFETMLVKDGSIKLGPYHWQRLYAGLQQLGFELPALLDPAYLEQEVRRTVKKNNLERLCRVRLQVFAGGGGLYGDSGRHPGFVIECFPLEPETGALNENGLVAGIATGLKKSMDVLANLKSGNGLIYAMAARQAREHKWNDALICNTDGHVIESTIANIFWIKDNTFFTPPLADGCIAGVMRRHIMTKIAVTEKSLSSEALQEADEVFLTNAIKGIRWVGNIGDKVYANELLRTVGIC